MSVAPRTARARRVGGRSVLAGFTCSVVALAVVAVGCAQPTQIVLVVDTNLTAGSIDDVSISVTGSQTRTIDVPLGTSGAPSFPLTLALNPGSGSTSVAVSVVASLQGAEVVEQQADTAFSEGEQKMLRMLLLDSCVGSTCGGVTGQTCIAGACASDMIAATSLPSWTGSVPASPARGTTVPIGGRTIWADGWHSCANEGDVLFCWGQNSDGEIGNGSTINANSRRAVMGVSDPAAVGLGELTTCICDHSGQAWCWGRNVEGELGIGAASLKSTVPVQVPGVTDCLQITGGLNHTCVLHADGTLSCWGSNASGQLGVPASTTTATCSESGGTSVPCAPAPIKVTGLTEVAEVRAGEQYTCARKADMTVQCWGENSGGELGDGTDTSRSTPSAVVGLNDIVEVAAGRFFACARHQTGSVSCWGDNGNGQLGNGTTTASSRPVDVVGVTDATQLAMGLQHGCALTSSATVVCWGGNMYGQLGDGTTTDSSSAVDVIGLTQINSIAAGSVHTCARSAAGLAFCWGENLVNELGDGTTTNRSQPVSVAGFM
jgi:alpha-tubulin suppressor-like RCC1 family protein